MSTKKDYSETEWAAISAAPVAAGLLITLADESNRAGVSKEAIAVGKAVSDSAQGDAPEIIKVLAESVKSGGRPTLPDVPDGAGQQDALIDVIKAAITAVEAKSPGEAESYKAWLASVALRTAAAAKEGGFLGLGGSLVSNKEELALRLLAGLLGVNAFQS